MLRRRWWEMPHRSLEFEKQYFETEGLEFGLDHGLLETRQVVVFRGQLRYGERTSPAYIYYPPAYAAGANPVLCTPGLRLGRHQGPDWSLCLDHPTGGLARPMTGAQAVMLAEELWRISEEDPEELKKREADAPDPWANYYPFAPHSAIAMLDIDVRGGTYGAVTLAGVGPPLRAVVTEVEVRRPEPLTITSSLEPRLFGPPVVLTGPWLRLEERPPFRQADFDRWLQANHQQMIDHQVAELSALERRQRTPAIVAFVYRDEGPKRDEWHDAWLFVAVDPGSGEHHLARPFPIRSAERWTRQPQLEPLDATTVGLVGVGALGSPIADLLSKAGIGDAVYVDSDYVSVGNRVRHQCDLSELGLGKALAMEGRTRRTNIWQGVSSYQRRLGQAFAGLDSAATQEEDDRLVEALSEVDLIINATAHNNSSSYLSQLAHELGIPVLHVYVSGGAWGTRILLQRPGTSGCWDCLGYTTGLPAVESDPEVAEVFDEGCADSTFTGAGFDLIAAAAAATRAAVQFLVAGADGYPEVDFDLLTINFRTAESPNQSIHNSRLPVHPECEICAAFR